jgi:hypothetical protein
MGMGNVDRNLYRLFVRDIGPEKRREPCGDTPLPAHDIVPLMLNK